MNAVSLFSGCGGLDFGFEKAGSEIVFYNDFDKHACETLRLNRKENVLEAPISEISAEDIKKAAGSSDSAVDLIIGGPWGDENVL